MFNLRSALAAGLLTATACIVPPVAAQATSAQQSASPRATTDLSTGWRFAFGDTTDAPVAATFDDAAWQTVDVPHTWNSIGTYATTRAADSDMRQGPGWYRRSFTLPAGGRAARHFLEFDAVSSVADVWVNGRHAGSHAGAFSRFRIDVTPLLRSGENLIVVRADNSAPAPGNRTEHVIPLGGDFFMQGGIYRGVRLVSVGDAHIDLSDHGGPGVYVNTTGIEGDRATISVRTLLRNSGTRRRALTLMTSIIDAEGKGVATDSTALRLGPGQSQGEDRSLQVPSPRLWQGRADPYLYSVVSELRDGDRVIDRQVQPLGIRSFAFDADRGFILNGTATPLRGVSRHQDMQGKGWALTAEDHARDIAMIEEIGANTVRHAHYQHAQEWADAADRTGMAVWAELPFVHQSSLNGGPASPELIANARMQLVELIRQNYNHPSIVTWSVGNEVDIGAAIAALTKGAKGPPAQSRDMLANVEALARQEDPSRPTVYADCCEDTPSPLSLEGAQKLSDLPQIVGLNRYFGWYYGRPEMLGPALDNIRAKYPGKPIMLSEYGAGGALTQHTDNPLGGPVNAYGRPQPEEYQSWVLEGNWKAISERPYLSGSWVWNMFDFATTSRNEGDATDINTKGLVSYDRETRKDAFYLFKANWADTPTLHLTGRRYTDRAYANVDVRAYSNADRVALSLNGKPIDEAACPDRICVWRGVQLAAGANVLVASATIAGEQVTDRIEWNAPDPARGVFIDAGALVGRTFGDDRYGSDTFFTGGTGRMLSGGRPAAPPPAVDGTENPALFQSYREGSFSYRIPLPDGRWAVTVATFEPDPAGGTGRSFAVKANGTVVIDAFAPQQEAGAPRKAVERSFEVESRGGTLDLAFEPRGGEAVVSAIAVRPL
ncbi:glycoside hydrolase family 2 TIM barrel-domain containing protein [Croceibacterium sp. TMG7-5b_MA50]|uniref:glycoside hydrolase family 2 TIM barrel-domain containing protein n=1 Tax=Croceibacterium sp. TMG7-5b_MA50 TaxID=3121290 RepID=UPI0032219893